MAATTVVPVFGASTCALGSRKWKPHNLTMKAIMHASHIKLLDQAKGDFYFIILRWVVWGLGK